MTHKNDSEPAFPTNKEKNGYPHGEEGMSLREHFATHFPMTFAEFAVIYGMPVKDVFNQMNHLKMCMSLFAQYRYVYADAMIEARSSDDTNT